MTTATSGVLARFPLLLPVRNSFATGPLPSLVLRTEDMWQKRKTNVIEVSGLSIRVSKETLLVLNVHCCGQIPA